MSALTVLITGAAGAVGQALRDGFRERFTLKSFDQQPVPGDPNAIIADLSDIDALKRAADGADVIVHLAGNTQAEAPFLEEILPHNIIGTYNVLQAAHEIGVRRVVFSSSCHTVMTYPADQKIEIEDPVRPTSLYGVSKAFGEVLGRYYHEKLGLEFVAVRIGSFLPIENARTWTGPTFRSIWLSLADMVDLFGRAVENPGIGYAVVFATSVNAFEWASLASAREVLGYEPQDSFPDDDPVE